MITAHWVNFECCRDCSFACESPACFGSWRHNRYNIAIAAGRMTVESTFEILWRDNAVTSLGSYASICALYQNIVVKWTTVLDVYTHHELTDQQLQDITCCSAIWRIKVLFNTSVFDATYHFGSISAMHLIPFDKWRMQIKLHVDNVYNWIRDYSDEQLSL